MSALDLGKVIGSRIHNVTAAPDGTLGLVNDWALNTANGDVYEKTGAAQWTRRGSFKGAKGDPGSQGPAGAAGKNGATPTFTIDSAGHLIAAFD